MISRVTVFICVRQLPFLEEETTKVIWPKGYEGVEANLAPTATDELWMLSTLEICDLILSQLGD